MGLFSRKTIITVSSMAYNLAGDPESRANFLKATVLGNVLANKDMGAGIVNGYLNGPGIKLRSFGNWVDSSGYNTTIGYTPATLTAGDSISTATLASQIPRPVGKSVSVQSSIIDVADFSFWTDQYIQDNYPTLVTSDYKTDIESTTNLIKIIFEDTTETTFSPLNFFPQARYLYSTYNIVSAPTAGAITTGAVVTLGSGDSFPDVVDWLELTNVTTTNSVNLVTETVVDKTYSDATPPVHSVSTTTALTPYNDNSSSYTQTVEEARTPGVDIIVAEKQTLYFTTGWHVEQVVDVVVTTSTTGGVTESVTTTTTTDVLVADRTYREDTQPLTYGESSGIKTFIYREGSGNAVLDAMFVPPENAGKILPFIPFRVDNYDVKTTYDPPYYKPAKRAIKKAVNAKYDDLRDNILDNASIAELDYVYVAFGVPLNVLDQSGRRYIYDFFKAVNNTPSRKTELDYTEWVDKWQAADDSWTEWLAWKELNQEGGVISRVSEPVRLRYPPIPRNKMTTSSSASNLNYNMTLEWSFIDEEIGSGILSPLQGPKSIWIEYVSTDVYEEQSYGPEKGNTNKFSKFPTKQFNNDLIHINWQVSPTVWKRLKIRGLTHSNIIYKNRSVFTTAKEALALSLANPADTTLESGFLIPIQEDVLKSIGVVHSTQLSTSCSYMVFNCYTAVKQKWYQTSWFKVILIIVIVVITVLSAGSAGPAGAGVLGANAAVGAAIGITNVVAAAIVGAIVNALAAMVIVSLITKAATKLFGAEVGAIVGMIAGIITVTGITGMQTGQTFASSLSQILKADNLWKLTFPIGNEFANQINLKTEDIMVEAEAFQNEYNVKMEEIKTKFNAMFNRNGLLDPSQIIDLVTSTYESQDLFLSRTLLLGTDIVQLSHDLLYDFVDTSLTLDLP